LEVPGVTDVLVNGPSDVWIDRGTGLERVPLDLGTPAAVRALAARLAALAGRRLDDAAPICDGSLLDGTRLHAVVEPIVADGSGAVISLRVLRPAEFTLASLVELGAVAHEWEGLLHGMVARRANVLISGATGTGKSTLLAALLGLVPPSERIVIVEEALELAPVHPHVVWLIARRANVEGAGAVTLEELTRAALRMRPDRLVVGECRGAEVREVLQAMNTGHDGGLATIHANAVEHVPARLEALAALAGMSREATAAQAEAAVDVVLHMRRDGALRFVETIGVAGSGRDGGGFAVRPAATWRGPRAVGANAGGREGLDVIDDAAWGEVVARWGP
jgi:pilus assembly protein CpaF